MSERTLLRVVGVLLLGGLFLEIIAELLHPSKADANNHTAAFAEYAKSDGFTATHVFQFFAILVGIAGLLVLYRALALRAEAPVLTRLAAAASIAAGTAFAILQAIDGVALKQAVDAWAKASGAQKSVRFADAETVRWLEWGANSYFRLLLGASLLLFGAAIVRSLLLPRWFGVSAALSGVFFVALGVIVGEEGFSHAGSGVSLAAIVFYLVFSAGILVVGWRRKDPPAAADSPAPA